MNLRIELPPNSLNQIGALLPPGPRHRRTAETGLLYLTFSDTAVVCVVEPDVAVTVME
jgi:hypothetical protein